MKFFDHSQVFTCKQALLHKYTLLSQPNRLESLKMMTSVGWGTTVLCVLFSFVFFFLENKDINHCRGPAASEGKNFLFRTKKNKIEKNVFL
jgi:hypothetical protein